MDRGATLATPQLTEHTTDVATRLGRVHIRSIGEGTPTVLWPSMFVDSHTFDPLVPLLPKGRHYLLVDPPGLGLSEPLAGACDISDAADAAVDLLDGLGVSSPVDWVGNAFGGHVGYKLGSRPGVLRSLVAASSPMEPIPTALREQIHLMLPALTTMGPIGPVRDAIVAAMLTDAAAACEPIRRVLEESLARPTPASLALAVQSFILNRIDVTAESAELVVPSLFVASDDRGDWSPEAAAAAAALAPRAEAVTIRGARTLIPLEQPQTFAAEIHRFWNNLN